MTTYTGTRSVATYALVRPRAGRAAKLSTSVATRDLLRMSPQRKARIALGTAVLVAAFLGTIIGSLLPAAGV